MSAEPASRGNGAACSDFADELQRLSAAAEAPSPGPELHLVTFALDHEEFGIPIGQVREVIRVAEITRVPQARPHVRGVTNLRGRILAVVEIRTRMGLTPAEITPESRVVVVGVHERTLGILVDGVSQVIKVPANTVAPAPEEVLSPDADYITGVARWNSRLIILLDLEKVLLLDRVAHARTDGYDNGKPPRAERSRTGPSAARSSAASRWCLLLTGLLGWQALQGSSG